MRIKGLDVGVESVTNWTVADEVHLPKQVATARAFIPEARPLEEVMRRPSLDEKLPLLLQPEKVATDLFEAGGIPNARAAAMAFFSAQMQRTTGHVRSLYEDAMTLLDTDTALDDDVRIALAAILRG